MRSAHRVFNLHVLWFCASFISSCFSFMYVLITSLHLSFGLPVSFGVHQFPSSMLSLDPTTYLQSFFSHGLTISLSLLVLALISSFLVFSILFIPIIYLNIQISVKFWSAFPSVQVSLPYMIITDRMTVLLLL